MEETNKSNNLWVVVGVVLVLGVVGYFLLSRGGPAEDADVSIVDENGTEVITETTPTVAALVADDTRLVTLSNAITTAGLAETLSGDGPFTLFAPTDDAFAALPEGTLEAAMADPAALESILAYHVVPGLIMSIDMEMLETATTVQGTDLEITTDEAGVFMVNGAYFVVVDVEASNGVIHIIDTVLLPAEPAEPAEE
jgi:uncharacterized surface protein with fasciclin (FAS1) repeats